MQNRSWRRFAFWKILEFHQHKTGLTEMILDNVSKRACMLFFALLFITLLLVPTFSRSVLAVSSQTGMTSAIQNTTLTLYNKTSSEPVEGFSNMTCKNGYQYVLMTGQYTAGNTSYNVIFLRMTLLNDNGQIIATGTGFVENVDAHKTKTFNAITRFDSSFSSCTIQIDSAIPK